MKVEIYTDGSSSKSPQTAGGFGAQMYVDDVLIQTIRGGAFDTTNNQMELAGLIAGMSMIPSLPALYCQNCGTIPLGGPGDGPKVGKVLGTPFACDLANCQVWKKTPIEVPMYTDVVVFSDSEYCVKGATGWVDVWLTNGWKTADKKPVKNQELWKHVIAARKTSRASFQWVKGHVGHPKNEAVDVTAGMGRHLTQQYANNGKVPKTMTLPGPIPAIWGVDWLEIVE